MTAPRPEAVPSPSSKRTTATAVAALGVVLALLPGVADARFFGVVSQGPLDTRDLRRMDSGGVAELRADVPWYQVEQAPGTYDWDRLDRIALEAARRDLDILPFVWGTPGWLRDDPARPPIDSAQQRDAWGRFLTTLVKRYGPEGELWAGREHVSPIRAWQIWNEPNYRRFYAPHPSPPGYARLLRIASDAIRAADPGAEVILAGIAPIRDGVAPDVFLRDLYAMRGARATFDVVALHPYARGIRRLRSQVRSIRAVMAAARDRRTPLEITELGWASRRSKGTTDGGTVRGLDGQARMLRRSLSLLEHRRRRWHIAGVHWFAWQDATVPEGACSFCQYSGLLTAGREAKPSWRAFKRIAAG